ncbi:MAG TPA: hypothetical protein VK066_12290 [Chloroflexota bacterium]|nr:hypothetical protein [Chloroflexota bacterium]
MDVIDLGSRRLLRKGERWYLSSPDGLVRLADDTLDAPAVEGRTLRDRLEAAPSRPAWWFAFFVGGLAVPAVGPCWALVGEAGDALLASRTARGGWTFAPLALDDRSPKWGPSLGWDWRAALAHLEADQPALLRDPAIDASAHAMMAAYRAATGDPTPIALARIPDAHLEDADAV